MDGINLPITVAQLDLLRAGRMVVVTVPDADTVDFPAVTVYLHLAAGDRPWKLRAGDLWWKVHAPCEHSHDRSQCPMCRIAPETPTRTPRSDLQ